MSAEAKTPSASPQGSSVFKITDFVPIVAVAVLVIGFLMYKGATPHSNQLLWGKQILLPLGNFMLFVYLLLSKVVPGLKQSLIERRKTISEGIQEFEEHSDTITDRYQEIREKLNQVGDETKSILDKAEEHAISEKENLIAGATNQAERVIQSAETLTQHEKIRILQELQLVLVEQSFARAEELLKQNISDEDQRKLQSEQLTLIEKIS